MNKWDVIVVDEAHKLGILGREPNLRWLNLGDKLIRKENDSITLFLSATPHRGKANDYLARLALLDPSLLKATNVNALDKAFDVPDFYASTHNVIVYRRTKGDVNQIYEGKEVFKPCAMLAVLVEPNEEERNFLRTITELATRYLGGYYAHLMKEYGWKPGRIQGIIALLRAVLVKRGLSSPAALFKTFSKLIEKRGRFIKLLDKGYEFDEAVEKVAEEIENHARKLNELLTGDIGEHEEELDRYFDELALHLSLIHI